MDAEIAEVDCPELGLDKNEDRQMRTSLRPGENRLLHQAWVLEINK